MASHSPLPHLVHVHLRVKRTSVFRELGMQGYDVLLLIIVENVLRKFRDRGFQGTILPKTKCFLL